jgi:NADH-quinone oxidoreductase subunit M
MSNNIPYLSLAIWLPIAFGVLIMAFGNDKNAGVVRGASLIAALISFLVTLPLYFGFDTSTAQLQFVEKLPWIEAFGASYGLGVDGLSVWFVILTALITIFVVVAAWEVITEKVAQYMAAFLILSGLMVGVFAATDGLLFYVFFEATLIPMYIIVGVWGGPNRIYAAFKFFLYTLLGSLLTLVAIIYLQFQSGHDRANSYFPGLPYGVCREGSHVASAHLVARCTRGGANWRICGVGCNYVEVGGLWFPALQHADCA